MSFQDLYLEEKQIKKYIEPVFESLINNNAPKEIIINVFFDMQIREYLKFLPSDIRNDDNFLKEGVKRHMVTFYDLPDHLKTTDYITKELYISMLFNRQIIVEENIYPQDYNIAIASMNHPWHNYKFLEDEFNENAHVVLTGIISTYDWSLGLLNKKVKNSIYENNDLAMLLIDTKYTYFSVLSNEQKNSSIFLTKMLLAGIDKEEKTQKHIIFNIKDFLVIHTDPQLALLALELSNDFIDNIHPMYSSVIYEHQAEGNAYIFLKSFLLKEQIENKTPLKIDNFPKTKI